MSTFATPDYSERRAAQLNKERRQQKAKLAQFRIRHYMARLGNDILKLTPDEALALSIESTQTAKDVGPFDMAYLHFNKLGQDYEAIAEMLEVLQPIMTPELIENLSNEAARIKASILTS